MSMLKTRSSGILCHITSLSSEYGIGDLGSGAYDFVDFLHKTKQKVWQILPLNPTDGVYSDSPYSSISAFATNTLLISPELLIKQGLLKKGECKPSRKFSDSCVDYDGVREFKEKIFDIAFDRFKVKGLETDEYKNFCQEQAFWLNDFALFVVIKAHVSNEMWSHWPEEIRDRDSEKLQVLRAEYKEEIEKIKFKQFIFLSQWQTLKQYALQNDVKIMGDIPIYVSYDSVDVWMNPQYYKLNADKSCVDVAGVPPDYFSETGQRWGNPVYDWDVLKDQGFSWWLARIQHNLNLFDCVRIDHFRGLIAFWAIPSQEKTAVNGRWVGVPYAEFFAAIKKTFPQASILAEDLGIITDDVTQAMHDYEFPGMKILLFAFNGDMQTHPYLPHNFTQDFAVYTGTHDNNTVKGWYQQEATQDEKNNFRAYYQDKVLNQNPELSFDESHIHLAFAQLAFQSQANLAVAPIQDILGLDASARMNTPSTTQGNWTWRLNSKALTPQIAKTLMMLTQASNRA